jgi:alpha-mannosidase
MSEIAILETRETIFYGHHDGRLCQWIAATIGNRSGRWLRGTVTVEAGGQEVATQLEIAPGVHEYRCHAAALWPAGPLPRAPLRLVAEEQVAAATTPVGHHRPWAIYLLSDVCTDYTWVYESEPALREDDAALMDAEIDLAEATSGGPEADRNHYNLVHARQVEFYLEHYPDKAARLFEHLRRGTLTLNPLWNMCLTGDMSLEELIRQLYPARRWAAQHGLDLAYANHQETPAITWAMASVLAGSGIGHLVKSILPYECPWTKRLEEPPLFRWAGPDGSQVLVRRRNTDYVEGRFVLRDLRATNIALHDEVIPRYEALGERYPFSAIALVGCYGDLSPHSKELSAVKVATIAAYNAQGWVYPRLVNAAHRQFWDDLEDQVARRGVEIPTYRGDYGAAWEAWPASLAHDLAGWRRAQERAGTADRLAAILSRLDGEEHEACRETLVQGWANLGALADHAWNGASDGNRALNAALRRQWQVAANQAFDEVIAAGLAALGRQIPGGPEARIAVFNGLGWARTGLVQAPGPLQARVVDVASGEVMPTQVTEEGGRPVLWFEARDVPPVGYRVFALRPGGEREPAARGPWKMAGCRLEGPFYALEVSPDSGGIASLYDKVRDVELVDPGSPYHLNQCLYLSDGFEHTPWTASVEAGPCGPLFARLIVHAALKNIVLQATITLYAHLDRVDIRNEVYKLPTAEKQELDFAFPFRVPDRQYRFEAPGAIVVPGFDQRPGSGQAVAAVRHFVDVFNEASGVTLSQADSGLVEFGHRTTGEDPAEPDPRNSTVLALALQNDVDWHEAVRDQAGTRRFLFRYRLCGHAGGFDPAAAVRFGWEDNNELLAVTLPAGGQDTLPPDAHAFVQVQPDSAILVNLKTAEEEGVVARLWECSGQRTDAVVALAGLGAVRAARQTDLLERDAGPLWVTPGVNGGSASIPLRARGFATARFLFR